MEAPNILFAPGGQDLSRSISQSSMLEVAGDFEMFIVSNVFSRRWIVYSLVFSTHQNIQQGAIALPTS
jgi:hypothetical protein